MRIQQRICLLGCIGTALIAAGCMTAQTYEGERRPRSEVAHIVGDMRLNTGIPISVSLRQVDGITLSASQSAVDVLPGTHTLLVDCRVQETGSITRHEIEVEVFENRTYRLVPETAPGLRGCSEVRLEAVE
jgi:hypothetical protein